MTKPYDLETTVCAGCKERDRLREELEKAERERDEERQYAFQIRLTTATHRCKVCDARWIRFPSDPANYPPDHPLSKENWSLASKTCGPCCDMAAMGDQIEPIGLTARAEKAERERDEGVIPRAWDDYGDDHGDVLWWNTEHTAGEIAEPPGFVGTPRCRDWPFKTEDEPRLLWVPLPKLARGKP